MSENIITENWIDPDDAPALDSAWFENAKASVDGKPVARRGRPKADDPKQMVSMRLDRDLLERLRADGPGWQTRVNDQLRKVVGI